MYQFEKLKVWEATLVLIEKIYDVIAKLPQNERFGLADQLRRAVISVALNIAEGTGSLSKREFRNSLKIARKSLYETVAALKIVARIFPKIETLSSLEQADIVGKMLNGLLKYLKTNT